MIIFNPRLHCVENLICVKWESFTDEHEELVVVVVSLSLLRGVEVGTSPCTSLSNYNFSPLFQIIHFCCDSLFFLLSLNSAQFLSHASVNFTDLFNGFPLLSTSFHSFFTQKFPLFSSFKLRISSLHFEFVVARFTNIIFFNSTHIKPVLSSRQH